MNESEKVLLNLIKSSLFGQQQTFKAETDWDEVMKAAKEQTVVGIAVYGAPKEVKYGWQQNLYSEAANCANILNAQDELIELFQKNGIPLVILKGSAAAVYYPAPYLRSMGDIDFIVPRDRFEYAREVLKKNGYRLCREESRHISFKKDSLYFELHHHFSYDKLDIERYIDKGLEQRETVSINNHSFPVLPRLGNGIVLLAHIWEHLQSGLGLRQVIDWMMYVDKELDDKFWDEEFKAVCDELGLTKLAVTTTKLCQIYLGLDNMNITWCSEADVTLCKDLLENLLLSGNFGYKHGTGHSFETVTTAMRRDGLFHYLQYAGELNWEVYRKHKWVKPFAWLYQIGRYLKQILMTKRGKKEIAGDFTRGKDRYSLLKRLDIMK